MMVARYNAIPTSSRMIGVRWAVMATEHDPAPGGPAAIVIAVREGEVRATLAGSELGRAPFEPALSRRARDVQRNIARGGAELDDLRLLGAELWEALLPASLAEVVRETIGAAEGPTTVHLELEPELQAWPWESLYDENTQEFLACDPRVSLVHLIEPPPGKRSRDSVPNEASMLVVIPEGSGLGVDKELTMLRQATARFTEPGPLTLTPLRGRVTPDRLSEALERGWDIVHFVGHGQVVEGSEGSKRVEIRLNGEDGQEHWIDADQFGSCFTGARVGMCVLNCCLGASASGVDGLDGLAPTLVAKGVRFVVAMRYEIADQDALRFANTFYRELFAGRAPGRAELATQLARRALRRNASRDMVRSFITPVFYAGDAEPLLLDLRAEISVSSEHGSGSVRARATSIPAELRQAIAAGECVPVVGADVFPATQLRGEPCESGAGHQALLEKLMTAAGDPPAVLSKLAAESDQPPFTLVAQATELLMTKTSFRALVGPLQEHCARIQPHALHHAVAAWSTPAIIYTHIDGLMEEACSSMARFDQPSVLEGLDDELDSRGRALILVRGSIRNPRSLVLTEREHDQLADRIHRLPRSVLALIRAHFDRRMLLIGAHPRDRIVRSLARQLLDTGPRAPTSYFVTTQASPIDVAYWAGYGVEIIPLSVDEFLAALAQEDA
jgi:hypothetical protein